MRLLLLLFLGSGMSGLLYQVVWMRVLTLTFSITVHAVTMVLCAFMAGLALGAILAGRLADRSTGRPRSGGSRRPRTSEPWAILALHSPFGTSPVGARPRALHPRRPARGRPAGVRGRVACTGAFGRRAARGAA